MPPGESSYPGGSEYVWQRGVEGILGQVTGGRSLPYLKKKRILAIKKSPNPKIFGIEPHHAKLVYGKK